MSVGGRRYDLALMRTAAHEEAAGTPGNTRMRYQFTR